MELKDLTGAIIGAAIEVHLEVGPGFLESVYENALAVELRHRGIPFDQQLEVPIFYRGVEVGRHRVDLFVFDQIVVELKTVKEIAPIHFIIVRSYLKALDREHGLVVNFAKATLEVRRASARPLPGFVGS
jgi:GxxExxY protein